MSPGPFLCEGSLSRRYDGAETHGEKRTAVCVDCAHRIVLIPSLLRRLGVVLECHYPDGSIARSHEPEPSSETVDNGEPAHHR
jgi:hypothetical protein